ncbi:hypothetical protein DEU42_110121 [Flavobacterium sp. AG291]|nr:hypothetical protein DEU42_110121 [Flavobacterium sp. AG291]
MTNRMLLFFTLLIVATGCSTSKTVVGIYTSRGPSSMETLSLMYSRGYFEFLYDFDDYIKLKIDNDSTFVYSIKKKDYPGRWKVKGKTLILNYTDASREDLQLKIRNNKLCNITEETLCKSKQKMMRLMLLEKKEEQ